MVVVLTPLQPIETKQISGLKLFGAYEDQVLKDLLPKAFPVCDLGVCKAILRVTWSGCMSNGIMMKGAQSVVQSSVFL